MSRPADQPLTAGPLILHFLTYVKEARRDRIIRYMSTQWYYPAATTRNALSRLVIAGKIDRSKYGRYRIRELSAAPAELETKPAPLTKHYQE